MAANFKQYSSVPPSVPISQFHVQRATVKRDWVVAVILKRQNLPQINGWDSQKKPSCKKAVLRSNMNPPADLGDLVNLAMLS